MNIQNFRTSINTQGILKTNKFLANFGFRDGHYLSRSSAVNQNLLTLRCDSATIPGVSLASADGPPRLGYGPVEKHPYSPIFEDLTLTFIVDGGSQVHKMLFDWVNCIVNFNTARGASSLVRRSNLNRAAAYEVGYRDQYSATLDLGVYRETGRLAMTFTAYNVFPMGIPQTALNWSEGEVLRLSIPFAYTDYSVVHHNFPGASDPAETGSDEIVPVNENAFFNDGINRGRGINRSFA
jgi:hypothetical protein